MTQPFKVPKTRELNFFTPLAIHNIIEAIKTVVSSS